MYSTSKPLLYAVAARTRIAFPCVSRYQIQSKKLIDLILSFISDISPEFVLFAEGPFFPDPISRYRRSLRERLIFPRKQELDDAWKKDRERSADDYC